MKEDLLHFLWRYRRFDHRHLFTTEGEPVEILAHGTYNEHAGPDFSEARVRIGEMVWAGQVEMHVHSSEWLDHGHQHDPAYGNVILHVVLEEDRPVFRPDGSRIPCLEMRARIPPRLAGLYEKLQHHASWIPCQSQILQVPEVTRNLWLDRLLVERLEQKTGTIRKALIRNRGDWEETFYQFVARNFGLKVNAAPFESLARSLPRHIPVRHRNDLFQLEALFFGQSGMLDTSFEDAYPIRLQQEYRFLQKKYSLQSLDPVQWKFLRMHPGNFPTIRLAQFARLMQQSVHLFSGVLDASDLSDLEALFGVTLAGYWLTHYTFDQPSTQKPKSFGREAIRLLAINTVAPFLFLYGAETSSDSYREKALQLLEQLPPERNSIIRKWEALGVTADAAYQTQALLQLKQAYCDGKRCLECGIGASILNYEL